MLQEHTRQVPAVLEAVSVCVRYPEDFANSGEEEATAFAESRQELFVLFRNAARWSPRPFTGVWDSRTGHIMTIA